MARPFVTSAGAGVALLVLGCVDVGAIPAPAAVAVAGPDSPQWRKAPAPARPPAFDGLAMAPLGDKVVLFGARLASLGLPETWEWNGRTWAKLAPAASPTAGRGHAMATLGNKVVLFGGEGVNGPMDDTFEWDGASWTQVALGAGPPARSGHAMATLGNKIVLFGGEGQDGPTNDTWEWDGVTWTQRTPTASPPPRGWHAMATLGDEVVLFGGTGADEQRRGDTWIWNGSTWAQNVPSGLSFPPEARSGHVMATLGKTVVMHGGDLAAGMSDSLMRTWLWDGRSWQISPWSPFCSVLCSYDGPSPRSGHGMATLNGKVVLFGGQPNVQTESPVPGVPAAGPQGRSDETWEWDGMLWLPKLVSPGYRYGNVDGAMAALGDKAIYLGGSSTWEWQGGVWTVVELDYTKNPPAGIDRAMATLGSKVVLFGGIDADLFPQGDTWEWDGARWTQLAPATKPPGRSGHAMATLGDKAVLFGGVDADSAPMADTWEWDGTNWTERRPPVSPPARHGHAMAAFANKLFLFGGASVAGTLNDTWQWDGVTWTRLVLKSSPAARSGHAFTAWNEQAILFGGVPHGEPAGDSTFHDSWAFDGAGWTQLTPATYPSARTGHAMVTVAGEVVLAGDRDTWLLGARTP